MQAIACLLLCGVLHFFNTIYSSYAYLKIKCVYKVLNICRELASADIAFRVDISVFICLYLAIGIAPFYRVHGILADAVYIRYH